MVQFSDDLKGTGTNAILLSNLTYGSTMASGTNVSAGTTTSKTLGTNVATFGADAHANGLAGTVSWTLVNDPAYVVDSYSSTATFTISTT